MQRQGAPSDRGGRLGLKAVVNAFDQGVRADDQVFAGARAQHGRVIAWSHDDSSGRCLLFVNHASENPKQFALARVFEPGHDS